MAGRDELPLRGGQPGGLEDLLGHGLVQGQERRARVRALEGHADAFQQALDESVLTGGAVQVDEGEVVPLGCGVETAQVAGRVEEGDAVAEGGQALFDLAGAA